MKNKRWLGLLLIILGASFWGIGGTVAQQLFSNYSIQVEWLVTVRLLISGLILLILAYFYNGAKSIFGVWLDQQAIIPLLIFSILGMLAVQYTYMASISLGNAAMATLLQYLAPVFIIIFLIITKKSKLTLRIIFAIIIALTGSFLMLTNGSLQALTVPLPAIIWGVLSAVALAFYTLYPSKLLQAWGSLSVIGWSMVIGSVGMSLVHPPWKFDPSHWTIETFLFLAFVILFGTMFAFWFYLESLKYITPQETSLLGNVEPLVSIISSVLWLKMKFGILQIIGMAIIIFLVIFLSLTKETKTEQKSSAVQT